MNITIASREEVELGRMIMRSSYLLISIRDPDKRPVRYRKTAGLVGALELAFHDAEPAGMTLPPHIVLMSEEHADQIADFLQEWRAKASAILVHCEQGMSRSPAVALAIAEHLKLDTAWILRDYQPNAHVHELVTDALAGRGEAD